MEGRMATRARGAVASKRGDWRRRPGTLYVGGTLTRYRPSTSRTLARIVQDLVGYYQACRAE